MASRKRIRFYKTYEHLEERDEERDVMPRVNRPSESRNPTKCCNCTHWITVRGRRDGNCEECHTPISNHSE